MRHIVHGTQVSSYTRIENWEEEIIITGLEIQGLMKDYVQQPNTAGLCIHYKQPESVQLVMLRAIFLQRFCFKSLAS